MSDTKVTWLTQDAYDRLKHELDEAIENRPVIAARINDSREEGDLKENGATTPPVRSRVRPRPGSATSRNCFATRRSAKRRPTTAPPAPARC